MTLEQLVPLLLAPLTVSFGLVIVLTGVYSVTFNYKDAEQKNHQRAAKLARWAGWFYIFLGLGILLRSFF